MLLLAHMSDLHLDGGAVAHDRVAAVIDFLAHLPRPVDGVLVTGDLADHGSAEEYDEALELFSALTPPVAFLPGNHDRRSAFRAFLDAGSGSTERDADADPESPLNQIWRLGDAVLALCDSTIPGSPNGHLDEVTRRWLDGVVGRAAPDAPLLVCFHHPPVPLHSGLIDPMRQTGEQRLATVLARRSSGTFMLCGHAHTPAATTFAGIPLVVAPGVRSTLVLPWEPAPDTADEQRPPALALHVVDGGRLTTHFRTLAA